jgi:O-antigen/teichoic acid export membrane protein
MLTRLRGLLQSDFGRRLALATVSSGAIWAAGTLATFGVGVILARSLGPTGYGIYGTAIAVVTLLAVPAQCGLPLLAMREVPIVRVRGTPSEAAAMGWAFTGTVAGLALVLGAGLWLTAGVLPLAAALRPALSAAAWLLPPLALSALAAGLLRGQERVLASQALDVLARPLAFAALLLAWTQPIGAGQAIAAQAAAASAIGIAGLYLFFRRLPRGSGGTQLRWRAWAAAALPMTLLELLRVLDGSYAVLVASYSASLSDAGLLRVAMASALVVTAPISLQNIVVGPFLAGAHAAGDMQRLARIISGSTLFMTVSVVVVTAVLALAGQWLLPLAFGAGFAGAYWPLLVLCLNQLLTAAFGNGAMLLAMTGQERVVVRALALSVAVAVPAALLLTPVFGVIGTAAATLIATAIRGLLLNRAAVRMLGIDPSVMGAAGTLGFGASGLSGVRRDRQE